MQVEGTQFWLQGLTWQFHSDKHLLDNSLQMSLKSILDCDES